jgi:hypothetical protein
MAKLVAGLGQANADNPNNPGSVTILAVRETLFRNILRA